MNISSAKVRIDYEEMYARSYAYDPIKQDYTVVEGEFKKENSIKNIAVDKINKTLRNLLLLLVVASFAGYYCAMISEYNLNTLSHQITTISDENAELENDLNRIKSLRNVDFKVSQSNYLQKAGHVMQVSAKSVVLPETKKIKLSNLTFNRAIGY